VIADWRGASTEAAQATTLRRAARAWDRAAAAEDRGARDCGGGLAYDWAAHSWRRCAVACELAATSDERQAPSEPRSEVAKVWNGVALAWEAAAAAWLAVAAAQRHLNASRAAEDESARPKGASDNDDLLGDEVTTRAATVAAARRLADERVHVAERCERAASQWPLRAPSPGETPEQTGRHAEVHFGVIDHGPRFRTSE
jgi:hypothetical protein